ncbi:MAG: SpoIID/LytB domain-containing protein [Candidatus Choladocola sp.]|nr:SpoIID/LytB domain-containing protein [Candidatus Choladocola sp.]
MSGKKWKGKLLLLICLTAWLLFLLIQDRTHDAEEPPSGNGEELILPEPGVPEQEETLSKIPSADACIRVLILNKSGGIYHETKEPDRKYPGTMQDYETENRWVIVNEVPLEEYLRRVVPSEMPSGYAEEALKAQAVCARTYAVWQMQEYAYPEYEAHVDDSVSFQVYNQVESQESTDQAVQETKGQIMLYEGRPVKAYYFATSCGVTTDEAIWEDADPTKTPYIEGRRTGNGSLKKSLTEETVFERFIRKKHAGDLEIAEPWYRWNCYLSLAQITDNVQKWLQVRSEKTKDGILVKNGDQWIKREDCDPGEIRSVSIEKRNTGGAALEMLMEGTKETLKIRYEYNIRMFLGAPEEKIYKNDGTVKEGSPLLPSGYFVLEPVQKDGKTVGYEVYGGGLGHGAGMSQNGARILAEQGESYESILHYFYKDIELAILE